ncbi:MAG: UDP-N-acetylmuramoyl-tripeptide--D-alanyl-D-alanine ligase, partial [Bacteroidales bacterium]|nr:UDP-N-acetylmuramoyl-tripeptide--D-alanyl-D-alanine ligase [Bacteroidales bacterium]
MNKLYSLFLECGCVSTDTRTIKGGELFFALKGENFDGNAYALKALEAGAAYAVVNKGSQFDGASERIVAVPDTLKALQALAREHREKCGVPVIGLTGTNGKTTTKELIRSVLATKYKVVATEGNLNNDIGVPLSLLKIMPDTDIAVIEMGASHPDDIAHLVAVAEPDFGLITNVGKAHLLGFGSFEGVCKAKGQLYDWI